MLRVRHRDHQEHGLTPRLALAAALALLAAGCGGADEDVGAAREADSALPIVGRSTVVAKPGTTPIAVLPALASRGSDFLAVWATVGIDGGQILATAFAADGTPTTPAGMPVASFSNIDISPTIVAVACAPEGDCVIVNLHADERNRSHVGVSTLHPDGSAEQSLDIASDDAANNGIAAGFDGQSFVVVYSTPLTTAVRLLDGAPLGKPTAVDGEAAALGGLACAADTGCLLTFTRNGGGTTLGAVAPPGGAFTALDNPISQTNLQPPVAGAGMYVALSPTATGYDAIRLGADGLPVEPSVIALTPPPGDIERITSAGFDGTRFLAILASQQQNKQQQLRLEATPIATDGTLSPPLDLDAYASTAMTQTPLACAAGTCEIALESGSKTSTETIAIAGNEVVEHKQSLAFGPAQQLPVTAIKVGDRVLATWNERGAAHGRWFDDRGDPKGDAITIDAKATIAGGDFIDDEGLLLLHESAGVRTTRLVDAKGTIHAPITLEPPRPEDHAKAARFLIADSNDNGGSSRLRRFDSAGVALEDQKTAVGAKQRPNIGGTSVARAGDLFVILFTDGSDGEVQIARARADGELLGVTPVTPVGTTSALINSGSGIACSPDECMAIWNEEQSHPVEDFDRGSNRDLPVNGLVGARFDPRSPFITPALIDDRGSNGTIAYDGESFVGAFTDANGLEVARLDVEGTATSTAADAGVAMYLVPFAPRRSLLFSLDSGTEGPQTIAFHVRKVADGADPLRHLVPDSTTSSTSESDPKCGCAIPGGDGSPSAPLFVLAAALSARLVRPSGRRRRSHLT